MHYQNDCLKKKELLKFLLHERQSQNCFLEKDIIKITSSKKTLSKLLPKRKHCQNFSLKEGIIKVAPSK